MKLTDSGLHQRLLGIVAARRALEAAKNPPVIETPVIENPAIKGLADKLREAREKKHGN